MRGLHRAGPRRRLPRPRGARVPGRRPRARRQGVCLQPRQGRPSGAAWHRAPGKRPQHPGSPHRLAAPGREAEPAGREERARHARHPLLRRHQEVPVGGHPACHPRRRMQEGRHHGERMRGRVRGRPGVLRVRPAHSPVEGPARQDGVRRDRGRAPRRDRRQPSREGRGRRGREGRGGCRQVSRQGRGARSSRLRAGHRRGGPAVRGARGRAGGTGARPWPGPLAHPGLRAGRQLVRIPQPRGAARVRGAGAHRRHDPCGQGGDRLGRRDRHDQSLLRGLHGRDPGSGRRARPACAQALPAQVSHAELRRERRVRSELRVRVRAEELLLPGPRPHVQQVHRQPRKVRLQRRGRRVRRAHPPLHGRRRRALPDGGAWQGGRGRRRHDRLHPGQVRHGRD